MINKKIIIIILILASLFFLTKNITATVLRSDSYIITLGNFNVTSGEKSSTSYTVTDTVGQLAPGAYSSANYNADAGFQYIYQLDTFGFAISDLSIDLGTLTPGSFSTDTNTLTITTKGAGGYTIYAYEAHPLQHTNGSTTIADTTCDTDACDETNADPWVTTSEYGFGFNINGNDTPADFVNSTYFRQFADDSNSESMQAVMSSSNVGEDRTATVTYKANVSVTQAAGNYETYIVYVAVPGY